MNIIEELDDPQLPIAQACDTLGISRATLYRNTQLPKPAAPHTRAPSPRKLSDHERQDALDVLHSEELADQPPAEVHATLLSRGVYLASIRTLYRVLAAWSRQHSRKARRTETIRSVSAESTLAAAAIESNAAERTTRCSRPAPRERGRRPQRTFSPSRFQYAFAAAA